MIAPYWQSPDGAVRLYLGDARDVLPEMSEKGHVIFDPPYSAHVHGKSRAGAREVESPKGRTYRLVDGVRVPCAQSFVGKKKIDTAVDFGFESLSAADRRLLAAHATRLAERWILAFSDFESAHLWRLSMLARGARYLRTGMWRKIGTTPQFTGRMPAVASEAITICHSPSRAPTWNGHGKHGLWDEDFEPGEELWYDVPVLKDHGGDEPRIHTTQKPEALMLALVDDFTDPGELVYDFTAGGCTTGIACMRAKGGPRRFVGIERDERFAEKAAKRLEAESKGSTYHAQERGQRALFG